MPERQVKDAFQVETVEVEEEAAMAATVECQPSTIQTHTRKINIILEMADTEDQGEQQLTGHLVTSPEEKAEQEEVADTEETDIMADQAEELPQERMAAMAKAS